MYLVLFQQFEDVFLRDTDELTAAAHLGRGRVRGRGRAIVSIADSYCSPG